MTRIIATAELMNDADRMFFKQVFLPNHCLHHLLPPIRPHVNLRHRGHIYQFPPTVHYFIKILSCTYLV